MKAKLHALFASCILMFAVHGAAQSLPAAPMSSIDVQQAIASISDKSLSTGERLESMRQLGTARNIQAVQPLLGMLETTDEDLRVGAIAALREIASSESTERLSQIALTDDSSGMRNVAMTALYRIGDAPAIDAIVANSFNEANDKTVRLESLSLIRTLAADGKIGRDRILSDVKPLIVDADPGIRAMVAVILADHDDRESIPILVDSILNLSAEPWIVSRAEKVIEKAAGASFGFTNADGAPLSFGDRNVARHNLFRWWRENRETFVSKH